MIFSLSNNNHSSLDFKIPDTDIFCLFSVDHSVHASEDLLLSMIMASLKMKKNVLMLERSRPEFAIDSSKRWIVGDNWCWLAPRALSTITEAYGKDVVNYSTLRSLLSQSN